MERTNEKKRVGRKKKYATAEEAAKAQRICILTSMKKWHSTKEGRANNLANAYKQLDRNARRGESTITPQWIIDNIFTSKCYWCGETDWRELGCDRILQHLPHTPDNVICSCGKCNVERGIHSFDWFTKYQDSKKNAPKQLSLF